MQGEVVLRHQKRSLEDLAPKIHSSRKRNRSENMSERNNIGRATAAAVWSSEKQEEEGGSWPEFTLESVCSCPLSLIHFYFKIYVATPVKYPKKILDGTCTEPLQTLPERPLSTNINRIKLRTWLSFPLQLDERDECKMYNNVIMRILSVGEHIEWEKSLNTVF